MDKISSQTVLSFCWISALSFSAGCELEEENILNIVDINEELSISDSTGYWTGWLDKDNPSGNGDYEIDFPDPCNGAVPGNVMVRTTSGTPYQNTREIVHVDPIRGAWCVNSEQPDGTCDYDYKVRFYCNPNGNWTNWLDKDNPSGNGDYEIDFPDLCDGDTPMNLIVETTAGIRLESTNEIVNVDPTRGAWCINSEQPDGYCDHDYRVRFYCNPNGTWTNWLDKDNPSGNGDYEIDFPPEQTCQGGESANVNVQTTSGVPYQITGEFVHVDPSLEYGGWCVNSEQSDSRCDYDYRVQYYCF